MPEAPTVDKIGEEGAAEDPGRDGIWDENKDDDRGGDAVETEKVGEVSSDLHGLILLSKYLPLGATIDLAIIT